MPEITVIKRDASGQEVWRYSGEAVERRPGFVRLRARFNREDRFFNGVWLLEGDWYVEEYYADRWYNIDAIYDRDSGELKAWYANVSRPAEISLAQVAYDDLALDLLVFPDGRQLVLDEDEFAALKLSADDQKQARQALAELQRKVWKPASVT